MNIQFPRISNRADWVQTFDLIDDDTGEVITDLDDVTVRFQVRDDGRQALTATTADGTVSTYPTGIIEVRFTASQMAALCPGTYEVGMTIERNGIVEQELIGSLPVFEGVARA